MAGRNGPAVHDRAAEVRALLHQFFDAVEKHDLERFLGLFTGDPDTSVIEDAERYDWAGFRAFAESFFAEVAEISFRLEDSSVHLLGPEAAVAVGAFRGSGSTKSAERLDFRHAFTFILARREAAWRIAHVHELTLPLADQI